MKILSNLRNYLMRATMTLFMVLAMTLTASATDFITDVMVAGNKNQSQFNTLIENLRQQGWTDIDVDLNTGCGSGSAFIYLLYKTQSSSGNTGTPITGFYIRTGANPPDNLTHEGRTYYLAPCQGSDSFVNGHGDLNAGCGSGSAYIFLYYTKDALTNNHGVTEIIFNGTQSGAVGENGGSTGYDLNTGCGSGSAYIYMHLTTTSGANVVTLCSGSGEVPLLNGHILTGTGGGNTHVTIADGATVTLSGVNITAITNSETHAWPGITCLGNATIVLGENTTNSVKGGYQSSGIFVPQGKSLTLQGSGTLNATGNQYSAGIGSGRQQICGNITISGGTITANGGEGGAGIGSGCYYSDCGTIIINGGTVNATGGQYAAGIGSGYNHSDCWHITIYNTVTSVTATKGTDCVNAIGAGNYGSTCQSVTIGGVETGNITMSPFVTFPYTVAFNANGGTGTMSNQHLMNNVAENLHINNYTRTYYEFEGWATSANGPKVYDDAQSVSNLNATSGATVTLYAKWIFIGSIPGELLLHDGDTLSGQGGINTHVSIADGATVTFSGVNITSIANDNNHQWPGITCLGDATIVLAQGTTNSLKGGKLNPGIYVPTGHTLTLQGSGTLNATGDQYAAGIGSGFNSSSCGDITISSGTITANGGLHAAGIGSGHNNSSCGTVTINSGIVNANGGSNAAGIGSGRESSCGIININGGTVTATGGSGATGIGSGLESSCDDIIINGGAITTTGGDGAAGIGSGSSSGNNYSSCGNITLSGGTVTASGGYGSAGIGSGYDSSCGNITITNGITRVTATKGLDCNNTIGAGKNSTCGTVTIGSVQIGFNIVQSPFVTFPYTVAFYANGGTGTMDDQSFMYNVPQYLTANNFTYQGHAFQGWATTANGPKAYNDGQNVINLADTIATLTLYAKWEALSSTTLPIAGYGTGTGGWHLIASPMGSTITPTAENGFLTNTYDLYRFNQTAELEWENWKDEGTDNYHFNLESKRGYLYANSEDDTLVFTGIPYTGDGKVILSKTTGDSIGFPGWNLIGNPFGTAATINKAFYRMNPETHADIIAADNNLVEAMEGIFVVATTNGEIITFRTSAASKGHGQTHEPEQIVIDLSMLNSQLSNSIIDRAIIRFEEGQTLPKYQLRDNSTKIYIPQDNMDYAVINANGTDEIPINFKAAENGVYTLTISEVFRSPFTVLRLIDHLTGTEIDLLANPSYTFEAKTNDNASRFRLVFKFVPNLRESVPNHPNFIPK